MVVECPASFQRALSRLPQDRAFHFFATFCLPVTISREVLGPLLPQEQKPIPRTTYRFILVGCTGTYISKKKSIQGKSAAHLLKKVCSVARKCAEHSTAKHCELALPLLLSASDPLFTQGPPPSPPTDAALTSKVSCSKGVEGLVQLSRPSKLLKTSVKMIQL